MKPNAIFSIQNEKDFEQFCLETFRIQYEEVEVYQRFVDYLRRHPNKIKKLEDIPFLPIELYKKHKIISKHSESNNYFQSSGTSDIKVRSQHFIHDFSLYELSIIQSFTQFIGSPEDYIILGLLPNYAENPHSSLIYMVDFLMQKSNREESRYYLNNFEDLAIFLEQQKGRKILLFGVSFALLDFLDFIEEKSIHLPENPFLTLVETGGMKGRKTEMTKEVLLDVLKKGFKTDRIFSEYSMTELLSQAYSLGENLYYTPNWMRICIRSLENPFNFLPQGRVGGINIIDLANRYSCSFIATQDLGKTRMKTKYALHPSFEVLGRIDHSDLRGCSLLVS